MCKQSFSSLQNMHRDCLLQISLVPILTLPLSLHHFPPSQETSLRSRSQVLATCEDSHQASHEKLFIMALTTKQAFGFNLPDHCWIVPGKAEKISKPWHQHSSLGFLHSPETKQAGSSICLHSTCPHVTGTWCTSCPLFTRLFQCHFFRARGGGKWDTGKCLRAAMRLTDL